MMKQKFITLLYVLPVFTLPVSAHSQLTTSEPAQAPERSLKIKSSGVPAFDFVTKTKKGGKVDLGTVKVIPRLNIGRERSVSAEDVAPSRSVASQPRPLTPVRKLPQLPVSNWKPSGLEGPQWTVKPVVKTDSLTKVPDVTPLGEEPTIKTNSADFKESNIVEYTPDDFKLLQAMIFLEVHKKYELAMGLFAEIINSPKHRESSLYHYAMTALGLNMRSEFRYHMMTLAKEAKRQELKERAVQVLTENVHALELSDIKSLDPLVEKYNIDFTKNSAYLIRRAQYFLDAGDLTRAEQSLLLIDKKMPEYLRSRLLWAFHSYRKGDIKDGMAALDEVLAATENDKSHELRSLAALTKGRFHFQRSEFKESYDAYLKVDKNSPHWLQAMVETAWTQILAQDYEGAAGNMFSLHTDFFKNAFAPESYIVRTVGYLNLCQYGDSMHVLQEMQKRLMPLQKNLTEYAAKNKSSSAYYDTVKNWAANPKQREVDGLPRPFIIEIARHPSFISTQKEINSLDDETKIFNEISLKLAQMEKDLRIEQTKLTQKKFNSEAEREAALEPVKIQAYIAQKARNSIKGLRTAALERIDKEKKALQVVASQFLKDRFQLHAKAVEKVIEQNDLLAYEIYSGAGEHIRYQMAGGEANSEERAQLKAEKGKSFNWKFKGEIWEDEIGHYRSSLKNVCPSDSVAQK